MSDDTMVEDCIANGTKQKRGDGLPIFCYYTIGATGGCVVYKNETEDKTLEEKLSLELTGFKTPDYADHSNIPVCVGPGETKVIKIETCEGAMEFSFSFMYETEVIG